MNYILKIPLKCTNIFLNTATNVQLKKEQLSEGQSMPTVQRLAH